VSFTPVPDRPLILDFGMHEGEDTEFYLACGADVIAFEANGSLVERNSRTFATAIENGRLKIVAGAIVAPDFTGSEQTFYTDRSRSVWGTTSSEWARRNATLGSNIAAVTVPAIDLKAILSDAPDILYAKIDIEGADRFVLDTIRLVGTKPQYLSIESDKVALQSVVWEIEGLQQLGYTRFAAVQQAIVPGSSVSGRTFDGAPLHFRFRKHASGPFGPYLQQDFKTAGEVIDQYRSIFRAYARYGDSSFLMRSAPLRFATRAINAGLVKAFRKPLCGWYDTHAAR
jgi:FkbM family methyltransferase